MRVVIGLHPFLIGVENVMLHRDWSYGKPLLQELTQWVQTIL